MKKIIYFIPAVFYYALIFFISSKSSNLNINLHPYDKLVHLLEFAVLAILLFLGISKNLRISMRAKALLTFLIGILFAVSDEIHQHFVPGRYSEMPDVLADIAGIIIGTILFWLIAGGMKPKIRTGHSR